MTSAKIALGHVACSCGAAIHLQYPLGTSSPAYYKTWCVTCGAVLEGHVEINEPADTAAPAPGTDEVQYVPLANVRVKGEE